MLEILKYPIKIKKYALLPLYTLLFLFSILSINAVIEDDFNRIDSTILGVATNGNTWVQSHTDGYSSINDSKLYINGGASTTQDLVGLEFLNPNPTQISFTINRSYSCLGTKSDYLITTNGDVTDATAIYWGLQINFCHNGEAKFYDGSAWQGFDTPFIYVADTEYQIDLKNCEYVGEYSCDIYIDDVLYEDNAVFRNDNPIQYIRFSTNYADDYTIDCLTTNDDLCEAFTITPINPFDLESFTYDVENTTLELTTDLETTCKYNYNGVNTSMTTSDSLTHTSFFDMGVANTSTKQFDITYYCEDNLTNELSQAITFYQEQVPLALEIYVPQDLQEFNREINAIEFHIETNYQATCTYLVYNMTTPETFTFSNGAVHKTNYSVFYPDISEYPSSFTCEGLIVNETVQTNVTFFLVDEEIISQFGIIEDVSEQSFGVLGTIVRATTDLIVDNIIILSVITVFVGGIIFFITSPLLLVKSNLKRGTNYKK